MNDLQRRLDEITTIRITHEKLKPYTWAITIDGSSRPECERGAAGDKGRAAVESATLSYDLKWQ
jgi:hypothetical protein